MTVADRRAIFARQPRPVGGADRLREVLDRPPIRRILGLQLELVVELLDHVADGQLGVDDAFRLALAPLRDRLVDVGGEVAVALQVVLIVGDAS